MLLSDINSSKKVTITQKMKEVIVQDITKLMNMLEKCEIWYTEMGV